MDEDGTISTVPTAGGHANLSTTLPIRVDATGTYLDLPGVRFVGSHVVIEGDLPFRSWQRLTHWLLTTERNIRFWLGDAIAYGETHYRQEAYQAIEAATGYTASTLANFAYVARAIPASRRRERLDWSHHAAVAALPDDEQDELLDRAERDHLPVRALYDEVRTRRGELPLPTLDQAEHEHEYVCRVCGDVRS
jgi:hypothetical protein